MFVCGFVFARVVFQDHSSRRPAISGVHDAHTSGGSAAAGAALSLIAAGLRHLATRTLAASRLCDPAEIPAAPAQRIQRRLFVVTSHSGLVNL